MSQCEYAGVLLSRSNLELIDKIWHEATASITHKVHGWDDCDCAQREINASLAISWLTDNNTPLEQIGTQLQRAILPESLMLLMEQHPEVKFKVPDAAWKRCLPHPGHWEIWCTVNGRIFKMPVAEPLSMAHKSAARLLAKRALQSVQSPQTPRLIWADAAGNELWSEALQDA